MHVCKMLFFFISLFCFTSPSGAQTPFFMSLDEIPLVQLQNQYVNYVNQKALPRVIKNAQGTTEIHFAKGAVAILAMESKLYNNLTAGAKITEITCLESSVYPECEIAVGLHLKRVQLIWKAHPNPSKIGKVARFADPSNSDLRFESTYEESFAWLDEYKFQTLQKPSLFSESEKKQVKPFRLTCAKDGWLNQLNEIFGYSNELVINEWVTEGMGDNPETGLAENRSESSHFGVVFARQDRELELINILQPLHDVRGDNPLIGGDILGLNIANKKQSCDITISANRSKIFNAVVNMDQGVYKPLTRSEEALVFDLAALQSAGRYPEVLEYLVTLPPGERANTLQVLMALDLFSMNKAERSYHRPIFLDEKGNPVNDPVYISERKLRIPEL